jgi:hypothetical protein
MLQLVAYHSERIVWTLHQEMVVHFSILYDPAGGFATVFLLHYLMRGKSVFSSRPTNRD